MTAHSRAEVSVESCGGYDELAGPAAEQLQHSRHRSSPEDTSLNMKRWRGRIEAGVCNQTKMTL